MKAEWEAFLQHVNICVCLINSGNPYIPFARDTEEEMSKCFTQLQINMEEYREIRMNKWTKMLRQTLRERIFEEWTKMSLKGIGVKLYMESEISNKIITNKKGLTNSEWTSILKMSANVAAVKGNSRRGRDQDRRCRHCGTENESLRHVLGFCPHEKLLINARHNKIRTMIAEEMKKNGWKAHEEICVPNLMRRVDIIAYNSDKSKGYIIDPTIRFEDQSPEAVHQEKCQIYNPCVEFFKEKYSIKNIEVIGLMIGARGTIPKKFQDFCKKFNLTKSFIENIALSTVRSSVQILHNHFKPPISLPPP